MKLPVFESGVWRARLGYAPAFEPGTRELAEAVGQAARDFEAVWMTRHGLCASAPAWARPSPSAKNWNIWPPSSCWPDRVSCLRGPFAVDARSFLCR